MTAGPKIRLVIDPGHGGEDPGAVDAATGLREADVTLGIRRALMAILDTHPDSRRLSRETPTGRSPSRSGRTISPTRATPT